MTLPSNYNAHNMSPPDRPHKIYGCRPSRHDAIPSASIFCHFEDGEQDSISGIENQ